MLRWTRCNWSMKMSESSRAVDKKLQVNNIRMGSSDKSDAGTLSRVVQEILTWLSDKDAPVFVVATANDITKLPPELTRAGRFDEIFFVSLPHVNERKEIFKIHLEKRKYEYDQNHAYADFLNQHFGPDVLNELSSKTEGFTGAEIEQVIREATRSAYARYKKNEQAAHYLQINDLITQIQKTVPLSRRNAKLIADLREWAKNSAVCVSSEEDEFLHQKSKPKEKTKSEKKNVKSFTDVLDFD